MKRIAAVAALIVAMLAVPAAAAMASTASSGSGSGHPGQGGSCPGQFNQSNHHGRNHGRNHGRHHRRHTPGFNPCFPFFPPFPPSGFCNGPSFVFTWAHNSNSFYEESGPALSDGEQFSFDGNIFTIGTANPTASSYTMTTVNYGPSIIYGVGTICSSYG